MSRDADQPTPGDAALDEATAALRDSGAADPAGVPPELRRATLQALWVADAARYETRSARRAKIAKVAGAVAAVVMVGVVASLAALVIYRSKRPPNHYTRVTPPTTTPATAPATGRVANLTGPAAVFGRVTFVGLPPSPQPIDLSAVPECRLCHPDGLFEESLVVNDTGGVANVVVSVERTDGEPLAGPTPATPARLDQKGCRFVPHVLAVMTGQQIVVANSDPFLHNVHALSVANPAFNFGQPNVDPGRKITPMTVPERFFVKCDVHPWMKAHISIFAHPFFCVSAADGSFAVPGPLPDGRYVVIAWHEVLGEQRRTIDITQGRPAVLELTFNMTAIDPQ